MTEAEKKFTETFISCNSRFTVIFSFREISRLGLPTATPHIYDRYLEFADELFNDPQNEKLFKDKQKAHEAVGGVEALGTKMAQDLVGNYKASVDAASLIFAHSVIDNAAFNYCFCCAMANPKDWGKFVEKKKVAIKDIKGLSADEILAKKVREYIFSLDRESILLKADRLFQVCRPSADFSPIHNYKYDRDRLLKLDEMRHEIVHESGSVPMLPNGDDDIWFLQQTANFFMALVNKKYNLRINPYHMVQSKEQ